jgi:WD40 repeat protein
LAVWDVYTGHPVVEELDTQFDYYWMAANFSPDDRLLLVRGSGLWPDVMPAAATVNVLDVASGELVTSFTVTDGGFARDSAWSPDGTRIAAGTSLGTLAVWDFQTGDLLTTTTCGNWINTVDWSPDGAKVALLCGLTSGSEYNWWIQVQDTATDEILFTLSDPDPTALAQSVTWSPDGIHLLTTGGDDQFGSKDNPAIIWDGNTGEKLLSIKRHTGMVWWGSWSPDGSRIVTGSTDGTTRIWNTATAAELLTLSTSGNWGVLPKWSPDGKYMAVGVGSFEQSSTSEVWRVWQSAEELIAYAKECCVWRDLTPEERQQFGLPERGGRAFH